MRTGLSLVLYLLLFCCCVWSEAGNASKKKDNKGGNKSSVRGRLTNLRNKGADDQPFQVWIPAYNEELFHFSQFLVKVVRCMSVFWDFLDNMEHYRSHASMVWRSLSPKR